MPEQSKRLVAVRQVCFGGTGISGTKTYLAGRWIHSNEKIEVINPFDGAVVDIVPKSGPAEIEAALAAAIDERRSMDERYATTALTSFTRASTSSSVVSQEHIKRTPPAPMKV